MTHKFISTSMLLLILFVLPTSWLFAQYQITRSAFSNGAAVTANGNNTIKSTIGQTFIGKTENTSFIHYIGFWNAVQNLVDIKDFDNLLPTQFELNQNYPNPFNPVTTIKYAIPKTSYMQMEIFNILGQRVVTLINTVKQPGYYTISFNASQLSSGLYFYRMSAEGFTEVKKLMVIK